MTVVDYLVLAILAFSAIAGVIRGFLREVCSLVTWILAFWLAWHFASLLEPYMGGRLADPPASTWAARALIFIVVLMIGAAIGALLSYLVRLSLFSSLDRMLGFLLGLLRGLVVLGVVAIIGHAVGIDSERWWHQSRLLPYADGVANGLRTLAGEQKVLRFTTDGG
ncbi:MAG: CvpA family protein [Pseudomonadota bacterium]